MSEAIDSRPFPRGALIAGAALIGCSLILATVASLTDVGATRLEVAPAIASRDLTFKDLPGGSIGVFDARSQQQVVALKPGDSGFVRVVLRGLARERDIRGVGSDAAFRLMKHESGMASLQDLGTGKVVTLTAFGSSNAEAFLKLLNTERASHE